MKPIQTYPYRQPVNIRSFASLRMTALVSAEGVAYGNAQTGDTTREKLSVVFDEVKMSFGANEEIAFGIDFEAAADVSGKVIDVAVIDAGIEAAVQVLSIETSAENAGTSLKFQICTTRHLERVNAVHVGKQRPIGLITSPFALGGFPVDFAADGDVTVHLDITTKAGISAAIEGWLLVAAS
jgi:hypothetical protein